MTDISLFSRSALLGRRGAAVTGVTVMNLTGADSVTQLSSVKWKNDVSQATWNLGALHIVQRCEDRDDPRMNMAEKSETGEEIQKNIRYKIQSCTRVPILYPGIVSLGAQNHPWNSWTIVEFIYEFT